MHELTGKEGELIVVFADQQLTSPDCVCTGCNISMDSDIMAFDDSPMFGINRRMDVELSFSAFGEGWQLGLAGNGKKISNKLVERCTVNELLFAVREKVKRGEK